MNITWVNNINKTCLDGEKIEELPLGIFVKVASVIYYFLGRLGNFLLLGIVHYEKFGQDPQKRSLQDRLLTFNALLFLFCSLIGDTIFMIRSFVGPMGTLVMDRLKRIRFFGSRMLLQINFPIFPKFGAIFVDFSKFSSNFGVLQFEKLQNWSKNRRRRKPIHHY